MENKTLVPFLKYGDFTMENIDDVIDLICYFVGNENNELHLSLNEQNKNNLRILIESLTQSRLKTIDAN